MEEKQQNALAQTEARLLAAIASLGTQMHQGFEVVNKRFEDLEAKYTNHDGQINRLIIEVLHIKETLDNKVDKSEFERFKKDFFDSQDIVIKLLDKLDTEQTATSYNLGLLTNRVETLEVHCFGHVER